MQTHLVVWAGGAVEFFCAFRAQAFAMKVGGVVA
jgi:hypothetical protein